MNRVLEVDERELIAQRVQHLFGQGPIDPQFDQFPVKKGLFSDSPNDVTDSCSRITLY